MSISKTNMKCKNCYGKGYSTRAYQEHGAADFIGDRAYTSELREEKIPCKKCSKENLSGQTHSYDDEPANGKPMKKTITTNSAYLFLFTWKDLFPEKQHKYIQGLIDDTRQQTLQEVKEVIEGIDWIMDMDVRGGEKLIEVNDLLTKLEKL